MMFVYKGRDYLGLAIVVILFLSIFIILLPSILASIFHNINILYIGTITEFITILIIVCWPQKVK